MTVVSSSSSIRYCQWDGWNHPSSSVHSQKLGWNWTTPSSTRLFRCLGTAPSLRYQRQGRSCHTTYTSSPIYITIWMASWHQCKLGPNENAKSSTAPSDPLSGFSHTCMTRERTWWDPRRSWWWVDTGPATSKFWCIW